MKKTIFRILGIVIILYLLKVAAGVWIIDQRENCHANGYQWDESTYICTESHTNTIQSESADTTNNSETIGTVTTGN